MRKLFLLALLFAASYGLKAQQLLKTTPADSLSHQLMDKYFKTQPNKGFNLMQPSVKPNELLAMNNKPAGFKNEDHMPVATLKGESKMPIAKLRGYYTMPVKRIRMQDSAASAFDIKPTVPASVNPVK